MLRFPFAALFACTAALTMGCFGDNSDEPPPGAPSILEIFAPGEADLGDSFDVTVRVGGKANEQLSVAIDGALGSSFAPQNKVVITDEAGEGTFTTRYTTAALAGVETITANVSNLALVGESETKTLMIYDVERMGNVTQVGSAITQSTGFLVGYPMPLSQPRVVRRLGILHPPQLPSATVAVQVGLYRSDTATSLDVIVKTTANLVPGANEIVIPPTALEAGDYWMVVAYQGSPLTYRSSTEEVLLMYKLNHVFSQGLGDKITGLTRSDEIDVYYKRNFYLVLRK